MSAILKSVNISWLDTNISKPSFFSEHVLICRDLQYYSDNTSFFSIFLALAAILRPYWILIMHQSIFWKFNYFVPLYSVHKIRFRYKSWIWKKKLSFFTDFFQKFRHIEFPCGSKWNLTMWSCRATPKTYRNIALV